MRPRPGHFFPAVPFGDRVKPRVLGFSSKHLLRGQNQHALEVPNSGPELLKAHRASNHRKRPAMLWVSKSSYAEKSLTTRPTKMRNLPGAPPSTDLSAGRSSIGQGAPKFKEFTPAKSNPKCQLEKLIEEKVRHFWTGNALRGLKHIRNAASYRIER